MAPDVETLLATEMALSAWAMGDAGVEMTGDEPTAVAAAVQTPRPVAAREGTVGFVHERPTAQATGGAPALGSEV